MCILLVEDEFLIRDAGVLFLQDLGYDVLAAEDGQQAFDYLEGFPGRFSGLVTDYSMTGGVTGAHVIHRMRAIYPTIPIILATGDVHAITADFLQINRVDLIAKPYELQQLADVLRSRIN